MAKKSKKAVASAMGCKPHRFAPRITFTEDDIKGLKDMEIGAEHTLTITGKLVSLRKDEWGYDDDDKLEGTFKILKTDNKDILENYDDDED